jgi:hypothetical protein
MIGSPIVLQLLILIDYKMTDTEYGFLFLACVLLVVVVIGVFLYFKKSAELIEPSRCPVVRGTYGVNPGKVGTSLFMCGTNFTSECVFDGISSLANAIALCNNYINVCKIFSYSPALGTVRFVNDTLVNSTVFDTYSLQYNVAPTS